MGYGDMDFCGFVLFASCVGFAVGLMAGAMLAAWACLSVFATM